MKAINLLGQNGRRAEVLSLASRPINLYLRVLKLMLMRESGKVEEERRLQFVETTMVITWAVLRSF